MNVPSGGQNPATWPTVSVVLPTYDRPYEMLRAADSVLDQDYQGEIELIVVFDGGDHVELPASRSGRTVRWLDNAGTPGLAGARNAGISKASSELVAFLDDDDVWMPSKLRQQVSLWRKLPEEPALVSCGIVMVTDVGEVARPMGRTPTDLHDLLADRVMELHSSTFLLKPSVLQSDGILIDEELPGSYAEDYDLLLRAARLGPIHAVPQPLVRITWAGGSLFAHKWRTIAQALTRILEKYPEFATVPKGYARIAGQIAFAHAAAGDRREARAWTRKAMAHNPLEPRVPLALLVSTGLMSPDRVRHILQKRGKGI